MMVLKTLYWKKGVVMVYRVQLFEIYISLSSISNLNLSSTQTTVEPLSTVYVLLKHAAITYSFYTPFKESWLFYRGFITNSSVLSYILLERFATWEPIKEAGHGVHPIRWIL